MRVGPRVWKTALAVTVAIMVSRLLGLELPVFAGVAAIICMQPTIAGSLRKGVERMQATIIGAVFSVLALMAINAFPPLHAVRPAMIGLTVLIVMAVTLRIGWLDSLVLAAATVVVIMVLPPDADFYSYALSRTVITFIGIVIAGVVNALFITPSYSASLRSDLRKLFHSTSEAYRMGVQAFCARNEGLAVTARSTLDECEASLESAMTMMQWVEEEHDLRRRVTYGVADRTPGRAFEIIHHLRESAATIVTLTLETLQRMPECRGNSAHVYGTLCELAQPGFCLLDAIHTWLAGDIPEKAGMPAAWTDDMHRQFIAAIREHRTETYPLVEVCIVESEIRRVTELLAELWAVAEDARG